MMKIQHGGKGQLKISGCGRRFIRTCILLLFSVMELTAGPVTVSGSGANREAALQEAFKEAVRQGIGTYIESSTLIRNDEIIRENIIELAYGYVDNYNVLSESKRGGIYNIRIEANVSNQEVSAVLANILPANTLTEKDREKLNIQLGNDITAQLNRHLQAQRKAAIDKAAAKICRKIFEEYRAAFILIYEFIPDKIQVTGASETHVAFSVSGTIRTNPDLYNLLLNSMIAKFERVLRKKTDILVGRGLFSPAVQYNTNEWYLSVADRCADGLYSAFAVRFNSNALKFYHGTRYEENHDSVFGNVAVYSMNDIPFLKMALYSGKKISATLLVYLIDKKGNIIWETNRIKILPLYIATHRGREKIIISPYFQLSSDHQYYASTRDWGRNYPEMWPLPCLERKIMFSSSVPIKIARNVAGVKAFLQNDTPKGEALLNQLLKGGKK